MAIKLTLDHTGKMEGIDSLSTSVLLNPNCQKNQKCSGSICEHCYAETLANMYKGLGAKLESNTKELTERILLDSELPDLENREIFRLEAFGDLNNETQLINYINIALKNPKVQITLYTKMYKLVRDYFKDHDVPDNFTLIISSFYINKPVDLTFIKELGKFKQGQLKSFTVYDKDFIKKHPALKINCGARACNSCRICYLRNSIEEVREILKSDRESATTFIKWRENAEEESSKVLDILNQWR